MRARCGTLPCNDELPESYKKTYFPRIPNTKYQMSPMLTPEERAQIIALIKEQVVPAIGGRMPLHATSQGKVLLSSRSDREVLRILEKGGMQAFTPHTITDPRRFVSDLAAVRQQGYAVEDGEYRIGLRSAAAPVYDSNGHMRYALGVAGLFRRVQSEDFQNAIGQLVHQARQLSIALGWRG